MLRSLILAVLLAAVPLGIAAAPSPTPAPFWLDVSGTPPTWNRGAALPKNTEHNPDLGPGGHCRSQARPPEMPEDKRLVANGWSLFGPYQRFDGTVIIMGMGGVDGMCRPTAYQAFVFSGGNYAGTLAPAPMDARTDGSLSIVRLFGSRSFSADFVRYAASDPLCCPSGGTVTVEYSLQPYNGKVRVTPDSLYKQSAAPTQKAG